MGTLIALGALIVLVFVGVVVIHLLNGQRADLIATHRFWRRRRAPAGATPTDRVSRRRARGPRGGV